MTTPKPIIGISCGDLNGIGIELIIKTFADSRLLDHCTPVIFASNKAINFYRKSLPDYNFNYASTKELNRINPKQINLFNCWEEDVDITPGQLTETGGRYAILSLQSAVAALKQGQIDGLLTAPLHKKKYSDGRLLIHWSYPLPTRDFRRQRCGHAALFRRFQSRAGNRTCTGWRSSRQVDQRKNHEQVVVAATKPAERFWYR